MKARSAALFASLSLVLLWALLIWLFSLHGTIALFRSELLFQIALAGIVLLSLAPLFIVVAARYRGHSNKKGWPVLATVLSGIGVAVAVVGFAYLNGSPFFPVGNIAPHLIVSGSTGVKGIPDVAVVSYSRDHERQNLTWGTAGFQEVIGDQANSQQHVFMLRGLEPGTEYWYRLGDGFTYYFTTPRPDTALRFAVGSDAHFGAGDNRKDLTMRMLDLISEPSGEFDYFFSLGDLVELGFRDEMWKEAFRTMSPTASVVPTAFVAGNHDTLFTGLRRYLRFASPAATHEDTGNELWRRFDVGDIHFIMVDFESSGDSFSVKQASWLEEQLQSIPRQDWTIVLSHRYFYSSGSGNYWGKFYDNTEAISRATALFARYDVDLVFAGHDHHMELLEKDGTTYVVAGTFGGIPDGRPAQLSPESLWYSPEDYGYVDVTVEPERLTIRFRNAAGDELNSAVLGK